VFPPRTNLVSVPNVHRRFPEHGHGPVRFERRRVAYPAPLPIDLLASLTERIPNNDTLWQCVPNQRVNDLPRFAPFTHARHRLPLRTALHEGQGQMNPNTVGMAPRWHFSHL
jgi:hypothetical protein